MKKIIALLITTFIILLTIKSAFATRIVSKNTWKQGDREQLTFESNADIDIVQLEIRDEEGNLVYKDLNLTKVSSDKWTSNILIPSNINIEKAHAHINFFAGVNNYSISKEITIQKMTTVEKIINLVKTHVSLDFVTNIISKVRKNLNIS